MFIKVSTDDQIATIVSLARDIWTEYYTPLIGREQVEYMLDRFQSKQAVAEQIKAGLLYFLITEGDQCIGYLGVQPKGDELFLSKIYLRASQRRRGYGKKTVRFLEDLARARGLKKITLTVNKNNTASLRAYEKIGFKNLGPLIQNIGGGFVMDDFKMEKAV